MAVTRAPKRRESAEPNEPSKFEDARIKEVIGRGGSVAQDQAAQEYEDEQKNVQLRLYQSMIAEIDERRSQVRRGKRPSRHAWIVAAIEEKLNKERQKER
jgi:hypothetical protein